MQKHDTTALSDKHREMLEVGSAIAPEIIGARGYRTVRRADVPVDFAGYQRRNGLVMPLYSPDGITTGYQLRPDRPRRDKRGKPIRYETPSGARIIADVHPRMLGAVADPSIPLWMTEGAKKGDALASRGRCAISLVGVWMFRPKDSDEMLPCFDHVALAGRRVYVVYDSDVMHKPEVVMALERLVDDLEARGARPLVVYLPDAPDGSKQGVDDYLAAGGTPEHLEEIARPFTPADAARERMGRDAPLREKIAALWRIWRAESWRGIGGHTRREIMRAMIEDATRKGEVSSRGVRVIAAGRPLAERTGVSHKAVKNALRAFERDGRIARDEGEDRPADAPARYILLTPGGEGRARGPHDGKKQGEREGQRHAGGKRSAERKSNPGGYPTRAPLSEVKRLRWSYVERQYDQAAHSYVYSYVARLGKITGHILEALIDLGGAATVEELAEAVGAKRARDLVRDDRKLRALCAKELPDRCEVEYDRRGRVGVIVRLEDAGIVALSSEAGDYVRLADDWAEKLGIARELGGEYDAERRTRERHARARRAYKARGERRADRAPTEEELDADPRREHRRKRRRVDGLVAHGMRRDFATREVIGADGFLGDLSREGPPVTPRDGPTPPPVGDDHPLACECLGCSVRAPRYASPFGGA